MSAPEFLTIDNSSRIAYRRLEGHSPGGVFLIGHGSDMEGAKALTCEDWARRNGRAFPVSYTHLTLPTTPYV